MLEFILVLPFIWIILMLTINFGHSFLERHRVLVAAREIGLRHGQQVAGGTDNIAAAIDEVKQDTLALRGLEGIIGGPDGECPGDGGPVDRTEILGAFGEGSFSEAGKKLGEFLGAISMTQVYSVQAEGPQIGGLLPAARHASCFAIDGSTWTFDETGGFWGLLRSLVGGIAEWIF